MKKNLVLFDFDGTLSKKDTYIQFIFYACGPFKAVSGFILLSPVIVLYYLKIVSSHYLKLKMTTFFFRNFKENELKEKGKQFTDHLLNINDFRSVTMQDLEGYKTKGDEVCIVSASLDIWIRPFSQHYNINYICTELEYSNGKYKGFRGLNCNRKEKAVRIKEKYNLRDYDEIIAYGNSNDDKYMFDLATRTLYIR